jgi:tetratricopeptide (TPR) repeat protein
VYNDRPILLLLIALAFSGCAGIGVMESSDPDVKLNDARILYSEQQRPLIAERLIRQAIDIYQERGDSLGLGHAHRTYADLLSSPSIVGWQKFYREHGFQDKSVTIENRFAKSNQYFAKALEYYKKAETQFREAEQFDALTNVYYNMGYSYRMVDDKANSCRAFDQSLEANAENIRRNPNAKVAPPQGFATYGAFLIVQKRWAGCTCPSPSEYVVFDGGSRIAVIMHADDQGDVRISVSIQPTSGTSILVSPLELDFSGFGLVGDDVNKVVRPSSAEWDWGNATASKQIAPTKVFTDRGIYTARFPSSVRTFSELTVLPPLVTRRGNGLDVSRARFVRRGPYSYTALGC